MRGSLFNDPARAGVNAAILTCFAVTQPVLDLLRAAPDFLVAHQARPSGILALALVLSLLLPAVVAVVVWIVWRIHARAGRILETVVAAAAFALMVMLALARWESIDGRILIALALLSGAAAAGAYARWAGVRTFTTALAPGLVAFPLIFFLNPGIKSLMAPPDARAQSASASTTPVVMVVFDQFPLTSLLGPGNTIDRAAYPAFAELAGGSTWYRNATTVSDYTRWALPAILTGREPVPSGLPVAAHHPASLFTMLGASHRMHVFEPITAMCPREICAVNDQSLAAWMRGMARTLSTAYLHALAPADFDASLPPIDQGWQEQAPPPDASIGELWYEQHRRGRRREVLDFIDTIGTSGDDRPAFHYLHVLLPHEPFIYFPGGQQFSIETRLPGLIGREVWHDDEWAVTQAYRRHLLQASYVDTLLGQLLARLKETGLYDRSLIVVTSDHGASFRPGLTFRRITRQTQMDILPVPLFIKHPHQTAGAVSDRNVESIDIAPTMADILDIPLMWNVHGTSAAGTAPERPIKRAFYQDATRSLSFAGSLLPDLFAANDRKRALFGTPDVNPFYEPEASPARELIGQPLDALRVSDGAPGRFTLDVRGDFSDVDPAGETVPAYLAGTAEDGGGRPVTLAIAVNGRVRATTRTYTFEQDAVYHTWSSVLPPDAFNRGHNTLEIFVVAREAEGAALRRVYQSDADALDLSAPAAVYAWGVTQEGFHDREWRGSTPYRWTSDVARITAPIAGPAPKALRVSLLMSGQKDKPLRVTIDGCEVFTGGVPAGAWSRVFDLAACPALGPDAVIELTTQAVRARSRTDRRWLGVAVQRIDLLDTLPPR